MQQKDEEEGIKVGYGKAWAQVRGTLGVTVILIIVATFSILVFIRDHSIEARASDAATVKKIEAIAERLDEVVYTLTLNDDQRRALRLDMPESLRRKARDNRNP